MEYQLIMMVIGGKGWLVGKNTVEDFEKAVTEACTEGWRPVGGVSLANEVDDPKLYTLTQAMVRGD